MLWESFSCLCNEESKVSKLINMQAGIISDTFSRKRMGLAEVGKERETASAWARELVEKMGESSCLKDL